ncbi:TetR/AcrR family transcriptional regulator [Desulfovibrio ferrophilus]|uniref:Regulatory protein TetR n=1 Tax=Desulfovibrio ferrophilus TaxID=241368 RepID=A0A2Z6B324_9BACT|nr:TetR/AcrR family transcriptional regulator [Desulfovibrio ferrophilus]BBD09934.1 regulatory protein TetR [Desulfovibrio ferrophilus]
MAAKTKRDRNQTEQKLISAVGAVLAKEGFRALGVNRIAREASVDKVLIYRYFGGLAELVSAYAVSSEFWPSVDELLTGDEDLPSPCPPARQLSLYFRNFTRAILDRPQTIEILAWELVERNELTDILNARRERTGAELMEHLGDGATHRTDPSVVVTLLAGAVNYLAIASLRRGSLGGIDISSQEGWERVHTVLDDMLLRIFG